LNRSESEVFNVVVMMNSYYLDPSNLSERVRNIVSEKDGENYKKDFNNNIYLVIYVDNGASN
jgi:hypothetical protein